MSATVGIIMGSDSDLPVMQEAGKVLDEFGISYELTIVSAHRTPDRMFDYARKAHQRDMKIIIAGAGGAAHLPGMVAALTHLPVIGVPVQSKSLSGWDSMLSILQMPPGVPVATVAINGARNAGILAVQVLALNSKGLALKIMEFKNEMKGEVESRAQKLETSGYAEYLKLNSSKL